ncbi:MAG: hypothetical protein DI628_02140 [Blastochloris viridis]|uniref:Uncharacterized protein n=1 Tax=Blastochloris viridis TaxID=1079 RepID=A0A6N4R8C3_BLAVI|nr:MAG: hypothetical protein DI628_02140 [Blastochloris viridis]
MIFTSILNFFLGGEKPLPVEETTRITALLEADTCPHCNSVDKMGLDTRAGVDHTDFICHVCGHGWRTEFGAGRPLRLIRPLGVVVSIYHKAFLAGDKSDKHVSYDD